MWHRLWILGEDLHCLSKQSIAPSSPKKGHTFLRLLSAPLHLLTITALTGSHFHAPCPQTYCACMRGAGGAEGGAGRPGLRGTALNPSQVWHPPLPDPSVRGQNPQQTCFVSSSSGWLFFFFLFLIKHLSRQQSQSELFIYSCGFSMQYKFEIVTEWGPRPLTHAGLLSVSPFTRFDCTQSKTGENDMLRVRWWSHS